MFKRRKGLKYATRPLTLDDKIVKDGLEAVGTLTGKEPYYVVGGVGVQSYLQHIFRRPTSDIDLSLVRPLNYEDFRDFVKSIDECLKDHGYDTAPLKHSRAFKLEVQNPKNEEEKLLIEVSRRNENCFSRSEERLQRELENAKNKVLEERSSTYVVASPEDLSVPKLVRTIHALERNPEMKKYVPKERKSIDEEDARRFLSLIAKKREEAMLAPMDEDVIGELRFTSDIYDVRTLAGVAGFNSTYFSEASNDYDATSEDTFERNLILEGVLPELVAAANQ